jgi:hypothetical protein
VLEDVNRVGIIKSGGLFREVAPVSPYPRINPQQQKQEEHREPQEHRRPDENLKARRRFTAMRELIEQLRGKVQISRVDFNIANKELIDIGLSIAEEEFLAQLLRLKIPLPSIEDLLQQLKQRSAQPNLVKGRNISAADNPFPVYVAELAEYVMRFEGLQVKVAGRSREIIDEINKNDHFTVSHHRLRMEFTRSAGLPAESNESLNLNVSILVGAVEVDESGRRAILYQRQNQEYGLYSDKSLSLSI